MAKKLKDYLDIMAKAEALPELSWAPKDPLMQAELYDQVMMNLVQGYFHYMGNEADHPDFTPVYDSVLRLQPNPDDTYVRTRVNGSGIYRVTGERGTVHLLTITLAEDNMGMTEKPGGQTAEYDLDKELTYDADGSFEFLLSDTRPGGYTGDWLHMPSHTKGVLIRQRSYDWGNERDARVSIERVDCSALKPRPSLETVENRLIKLAEYAERHSRQWLRYQNQMREKGLINRVEHHGFTELGGVRVQVYWWGIFEIEPDEALVLETEVPKDAPYWNVQLNDEIWNTVEYIWRQSSLNGHQARLDSDGKFRAVISLQDPGVPNWLDPWGRTQGSIVGRWYQCDTNPVPTLNKVKLSGLRDQLPNDTPHVSPEERDRQIRARARGAQLRRRW